MAKRPLGQHFLIDCNIIDNIIQAAQSSKKQKVLEIGPGTGALTSHLTHYADKVITVEVDENLAKKISPKANLTVVQKDILKTNLKELLGQQETETENNLPLDWSWQVVANLPYYITTPILEKLLIEGQGLIDNMILMMQKEVAERLMASGTRQSGSLSLFVQYYASPEYLFTVPPKAFAPPPKVDSAVISLKMHKTPPVDAPKDLLFKVTRSAFQERRKTLLNTLIRVVNDKEKLKKAFALADIEPSRRPETLTLEDFSRLTKAIQTVVIDFSN